MSNKKNNFHDDFVKAIKKSMREEYGLMPTKVQKSKKAYNRQKSKRIDLNNSLYEKYRMKADELSNVIFAGRLGKYQYYDMDKVIKRINELAAKAKAEGLTDEELVERDKLRRIYIDSVKASLTGHLDNTYIVRPDGTKEKLGKKGS